MYGSHYRKAMEDLVPNGNGTRTSNCTPLPNPTQSHILPAAKPHVSWIHTLHCKPHSLNPPKIKTWVFISNTFRSRTKNAQGPTIRRTPARGPPPYKPAARHESLALQLRTEPLPPSDHIHVCTCCVHRHTRVKHQSCIAILPRAASRPASAAVFTRTILRRLAALHVPFPIVPVRRRITNRQTDRYRDQGRCGCCNLETRWWPGVAGGGAGGGVGGGALSRRARNAPATAVRCRELFRCSE
jgi:hypothetical protein